MSKKTLRNTPRLDYKELHSTEKKKLKEEVRISEIVDQFEQALVMDEEKLKNQTKKIDLEITRFLAEYDVAVDEIEDIKDGIHELKDIIRRYESAHIDLKSAIGDGPYTDEYPDYGEKILKMTEWLKLAKKTIADRRKADQAVVELREVAEQMLSEKNTR